MKTQPSTYETAKAERTAYILDWMVESLTTEPACSGWAWYRRWPTCTARRSHRPGRPSAAATGETGRPVGDGLGNIGTGLGSGVSNIGKGVEDAGQWKKS